MKSLSIPFPSSNDVSEDEAARVLEEVVGEGAGMIKKAFAAAGLTKKLAGLIRLHPSAPEWGLHEMLRRAGCDQLQDVYEELDDFGEQIIEDKKSFHCKQPTVGKAMSLFGEVTYRRCRYRPSGKGDAVVPLERLIGLCEGGMTPLAAKLSTYLLCKLTAEEAVEAWNRLVGENPSASSISRLSQEADKRWHDMEIKALDEERRREALPEGTATIMVALDGVMLRMHKEQQGSETREAGWREASCGVVAFLDKDGNTLGSRKFGRMPEAGKTHLKRLLAQEVAYWMGQGGKDLRLLAIADGAPDNWTFLDHLMPDEEILDIFHAIAHLKDVADAAYGSGSDQAMKWFLKYRHILRHEADGAAQVINAIRYLVYRDNDKGQDVLERELEFFRNNRCRMGYLKAREDGYVIGSGAVESTCKNLVQQRMKRSGQRWSRPGGQAVLTFRALHQSGRFDAAWERVAQTWQATYPSNSANDNRELAMAA